MKKILPIVITVFFFSMPVFAAQAEKEWTVMLFDNIRHKPAPYKKSTAKVFEYIGSSDNVNIVAQLAPQDSRDDDNPWNLSRRYYFAKPGGLSRINAPVLWSGNVDLYDYNRVIDFVSWAKENFPAKRYALIVAGHGGGWENSNGAGKAANGKIINAPAFAPMFEGINAALGKKLDIYYSESSLMQSVDVVYQLKDLVNVLIGSEDSGWTSLDPDVVWPRFFAQLAQRPGLAAEAYAATFAEDYTAQLKNLRRRGVISAVKSEGVVKLGPALALWASQVVRINDRNAVLLAKKDVVRFFNMDYADLSHFIRLYAANVAPTPTADAAAIAKFKELSASILAEMNGRIVVRSGSNSFREDKVGGLSVEIPQARRSGSGVPAVSPVHGTYEDLTFAKAFGWKNFYDYLDSVN